jgi:hypothetical protein
MARVISSVAGTRTEPKDGYSFVRNTTATFKIIFENDGKPTTVDTATVPEIKIFAPQFLGSASNQLVPQLIASIQGSLTPGQEFEYSFEWNVPGNATPSDEYTVSYQARIGGTTYNFGDEFFRITAHAGMINTKTPAYATVDDVRKKKFNIDSYLPEAFRKDIDSRNSLIEDHLQDATIRLREELNLFKARGMSENYRLFCIYYSIWSIMLAARGEDGASVSDSNLNFYRAEWERILAQEKREGVMQGIPIGRG